MTFSGCKIFSMHVCKEGVGWPDLWMVASCYEGVGGVKQGKYARPCGCGDWTKSFALSCLFNNTKFDVKKAD